MVEGEQDHSLDPNRRALYPRDSDTKMGAANPFAITAQKLPSSCATNSPLNPNPLQQLLRQQPIRRRRRAYAKKAKVKLPGLEEFKNKIMELPIAVSQ